MTLPAPSDLGLSGGVGGRRDMGWHADPWQRHQLRFHDGAQWTEHVADGGFPSLDSTPVADLPRSRPARAQEAPPGGDDGPRVVPDADRRPVSLDAELLLLDGRVGDAPTGVPRPTRRRTHRRTLRGPDDQPAGWVERPRPTALRRAVGLLVADPSEAVTRIVVRAVGADGGDGAERLRLSRPARRMAPVVDVEGADGLRGTIRAESVRQGLRADVRSGDEVVGRLEQVGQGRTALQVVAADGARLARLSAVWDVPGRRRHLPPGVLLVDRRPPDGGPLDPGRAALLLGALLAAELLLPPPPPAP